MADSVFLAFIPYKRSVFFKIVSKVNRYPKVIGWLLDDVCFRILSGGTPVMENDGLL